MQVQTIHLHRAAPAKPAVGAPCNGCGVCCAAEPCPAGQLVFLRRHGTCPALTWHDTSYRCGLLLAPQQYLRWLPGFIAPLAKRAIHRWVAAGYGCDSWVDARPDNDVPAT